MKRISLLIPDDLYMEVLKVAKSDNRTFTYAATVLLHKALKEKNRKRVKKEVHFEHNSSN